MRFRYGWLTSMRLGLPCSDHAKACSHTCWGKAYYHSLPQLRTTLEKTTGPGTQADALRNAVGSLCITTEPAAAAVRSDDWAVWWIFDDQRVTWRTGFACSPSPTGAAGMYCSASVIKMPVNAICTQDSANGNIARPVLKCVLWGQHRASIFQTRSQAG